MNFPWDFALIFLVLAILIPWRGTVRIRSLLARSEVSTVDRLAIYASTIAFQWLLAGIVAWRCFARGLSLDDLALTLRSPAKTSVVAVGVAAFLGVIQYIGIRRTAMLPAGSHSRLRKISLMLMPASLVESLVFGVLAFTASVCEEFIYRGFVFAVLDLSIHSIALAIVGSSLMFSIAHIYQGRRGLISTFVLGLIFAATRLWVGNLFPAIAGHLAVDLLAGYLGPRYLRQSDEDTRPDSDLVAVESSGSSNRGK